jgi:potassium-transporting ATPase KdpC subunit
MRRDIINAFRSMVVLAVVFGLGYPLLVTGVGQLAYPGKADGSLIRRNGVVVGSALIGQQFYENVVKDGKLETKDGAAVTQPDPAYFQTRPSGTDPADNAAGSSFANYGPNSLLTKQAIQGNVTTYLELNTKPAGGRYDTAVTSAAQVPVDAADTSASGIDPDISVANARIQAYRIAGVRKLSLGAVDRLISQHTTGRSLGFLGEPGVDVLELNLALDRISHRSH